MRRPRIDVALWSVSAAAAAALALYLCAGHGRLDFQGYALGRDFINVWSAGRLIREGHTLSIFNPRPFLTGARRLFDPHLPFHFWSYPPPTLLMVAPLGWTGYLAGLAIWTTLGLAALAVALRAFSRSPDAAGLAPLSLLVLASPAVLTNIALGQNGTFSAALLIGGLALSDRRPIAAGLWLGLLIFKPQVAILLPVMVIAGARWRTMAAAGLSAGGLIALSVAVFGVDAWRAFIAHTLPMQTQMLRFGSGPFQTMMPSPYMAARLLHAPWVWALAAQAPFTMFGGWLVWRAWRSDATLSIRAGVLMAATFIASPQAFNYDLIPVGLAALILWRLTRTREARGIALAAWGLPMLMAASIVPIVFLALRIAPIAPLILTALAWRLAKVGGVFARYRPSRAPRASTGAQAASNT